jgi:hypothetical protein
MQGRGGEGENDREDEGERAGSAPVTCKGSIYTYRPSLRQSNVIGFVGQVEERSVGGRERCIRKNALN